ncbi:MAG: thrombospondin type 3 repeat-containing protein, partial [Chloroflexi bacterium]|nr:thrombospondin type 3 repeat-containing protein [Chloroflexota bacterium]
ATHDILAWEFTDDIDPSGNHPQFPDADGDGVPDVIDNCPDVVNSDQADADDDGIGDVCDPTPNGEEEGDGSKADLLDCKKGGQNGRGQAPGQSGDFKGKAADNVCKKADGDD